MSPDRLAELARRAASFSTLRQRVGAVISSRNRILSVGCNKRKTHPQSPSKWSIHAEVDALLGLPREVLNGSTVCVVRLTKRGLLAMSRPCAGCVGILLEAGVSKVIFSGQDRQLHVEEW